MYGGGQGRSSYVAYVGLAGNLRQRLSQHLVTRDSSIVTGVSAASLNPDLVTKVQWWEHSDFEQRAVLEAAELVAFDVLQPVLRSRGAVTERAKLLYTDASFQEQMQTMFKGAPTGVLTIHMLQHALERIGELERRVETLEQRLQEQ
jgi:polyhydroxyalkanoate synthesis regulator phasin